MPESKAQQLIFGFVMAFVMVYGMVCYNIAIEMGGMTNEIFGLALHECIIMVPLAFILEALFVERLAVKLAFRFVNPKTDRPIVVILGISSMIVVLMCPLMSFFATLLFANAGNQLIAVWLQKVIINFPMALGWQVFVAGPLVRNFFGTIGKLANK